MTLVRTLISVAFVGALAACQSTVSVAPTTPRGALPTAKSFAPAVPSFGPYSNRALARDFLDLHFSLENGRTLDRFTRFEGPITVSIAGGHTPLADRELSQLLRTLRTQAGVPINYSNDQENANIVVEFVPAAQLRRRAPNTACIVVPNVTRWDALNSTSRADLDWNTLETRSKIGIFLPSDVAPQELRDCLHEELAQALGPLNDLYRLEHSVYNDDNIHSVLSDYDLLILRATYAGELRSGMSREQVAQRIPTILARLNPRGQSLGDPRLMDSPDDWKRALETSMAAGSNISRISNAKRAAQIATRYGWTDARAGFSWFLVGRLTFSSDPKAAADAFDRAAAIYGARSATKTHRAHVALQRAALHLAQGEYEAAYDMSARALPIARSAQNAALYASLLMVEAESLEALGRNAEAHQLRPEALAYARYGFGRAQDVYARVDEIAALDPNQ